MGGGWVLRLPVVASELSITTMSPVVCRGGGLAGNKPEDLSALPEIPEGAQWKLFPTDQTDTRTNWQ